MDTKSADPKIQIKELALAAGFDAVGIASLEDGSLGSRRFREWLKRAYHGEMDYLSRGQEKRERPGLILEGAKSAIVLTSDYGRSVRNESEGPRSPFISRYAWGEDYHEVLKRKVDTLILRLLETFADSRFKGYTDTGPVMEKYWAARTGLGWMGKHTNLIHADKGSYFFLSCLLTDLSLAPDSPSADRCGRCTACIDVCPTAAIVAPYVLDARRCISYLTIELKGPIPREFRAALGNHVFGCDDCQEICPWNREARLPEEFLRNVSVTELVDYLSLSPEGFNRRFRGSPVLRAKRRGFLRNVCVVLGNLGDPSAIPALTRALYDREPLVRAHAAWALGRFSEDAARQSLQEGEMGEEVEWVRKEIREALLPPSP